VGNSCGHQTYSLDGFKKHLGSLSDPGDGEMQSGEGGCTSGSVLFNEDSARIGYLAVVNCKQTL